MICLSLAIKSYSPYFCWNGKRKHKRMKVGPFVPHSLQRWNSNTCSWKNPTLDKNVRNSKWNQVDYYELDYYTFTEYSRPTFLQFSHYRTLSMQRSKFWTVTHSECAALSLSPTVLIVMCHILAVNSCRWLAVDKLHAGWHVNQNNDISSYFNNCKSSHMSLSEDTWEMSQQQNFVLWQIFKCCQIFFLTETFCLRPNLFLTSESFKIWYFLIHSFF